MALTKATFAMISGAPYNVLDYGADPTGVADSTSAFNAALAAAVAAGGGAVYAPSGSYLINGRVDINSNNIRIYGDGDSSILKKTSSATHLSLFFFTNGVRENVEIDHFKFTSDIVYVPEYSWAFIDGALGEGDMDNISIHHNHFTAPNENRAAIIFGVSPAGRLDRLNIHNNTFKDFLGAGIAVLNQNSDSVIRNIDVKITNNIFQNVQYFCITISGPCRGLIISSNTFMGTSGYGVELVAGIVGGLIEGNIFSGTFAQPMISLSGAAIYGQHTNVIIRGNTTTGSVTGTLSFQSATKLVVEGNNFNTTGAPIFSGVNAGLDAWFINNRTNLAYQAINGAVVSAFNNYPSTTPPLEGGFVKSVQLSGGGTTSTVVITAAAISDWTPVAFRVSCAQVFGDGSGGGFAQSIIAMRTLNSGTAVEISKTDTVTSAGVTLSVAYGTGTATVTATSGTANVLQRWKVEVLSDGISTIA